MEPTPLVLKLVNEGVAETPYVLVDPGSPAEELWRGRGYVAESEASNEEADTVAPKRRGRPPGSGKATE
jgi:hypothetical protein